MVKEKRASIISLHEASVRPVDIAKTLKISISTVRRAIKRFEETGGLEDRQRSGRPPTACTPANREKLRKRIQRNPKRSMRGMARSMQISDWAVRKMVKNQLDYRPYKIQEAHFLSETMKKNRLQKARKMKRLAAAGRHRSILFTDEKIFTIEAAHNHQNDRQLLPPGSLKNQKMKFVERSHFPASVMVFGGITASGTTPLVFVEKGAKVNAKMYQESILKNVVDPWARNHFKGADWTFQQDWAPAHSAATTLALCKSLFPKVWDKTVWPANSPDLNPMDYSVWSIFEKKVCSKRHSSVESLKRSLKKAWKEITVDTLSAIVDNFPKRLQACIDAEGDHFEHLLKK